MQKINLGIAALCLIFILTGCAHYDTGAATAPSGIKPSLAAGAYLQDPPRPVPVKCPFTSENPSDSIQAERDHLYSLLALTLVNRDWQEGGEKKRGHNIGSVLVKNTTGEVVYYARNSNNTLKNASQHGEVRLVTNFLKCYDKTVASEDQEQAYLRNYTLYTTLEPCLMCAGMLAITKVSRVVFVQRDPAYGDTQNILVKYPVCYPEATVNSSFKRRLESGFEIWKPRRGNRKAITVWLQSDEAHQIFIGAENELGDYINGTKQIIFKENNEVLSQIMAFFENMPEGLKELYGEDMAQLCPFKQFKLRH